MIPRLLYQLASELIDAGVLKSLDILVRRFVRRRLHLASEVPNSLIQNLGVLCLTVATPMLQIARFERIEKFAFKKHAEL